MTTKGRRFSVRKLEAGDTLAYREIRLEALLQSPEAFSESFEDELREPDEFFKNLIGSNDEHFTVGCWTSEEYLVGVATFKRDKRSKARHKSYIHTMYVSQSSRGHRIGAVLLAEIVETVQFLEGLEQIHLWVLNPDKSLARGLYLKAGFVPQGLVVRGDLKIDGKYTDAEYLVLSLDALRT